MPSLSAILPMRMASLSSSRLISASILAWSCLSFVSVFGILAALILSVLP